jgi:hypothetical protein
MTAVARARVRAFSGTDFDVESFKVIALFCGVGLVVSLLLAMFGLDISAGFF